MQVQRPAHTSGTTVVSLNAMKEFLRVDHSDEDSTITALLDAAVAWVEDYTNRSFTGSNAYATFYLSHFRPASLSFGPVASVADVKYDDTSGNEQTLDTSLYYTTATTGDAVTIYFHDTPSIETHNAQGVRVRCAVGQGASKNVAHAVKMLVAHWYENRRAVITGTNPIEVPLGVQALLNVERIIDARQ